MRKTTPIVSILCAIKNESPYIVDAIGSVINQDYANIELICVDDFSSDNTLDILKQLEKSDSRIKVFSNEVSGKNNAYNLAFQYSKGEYIVFFAGDDLMTRNSITSRLNAILANKNIDIASGRIQSFESESGNNYNRKSIIYPRKSGYNHSGGCIIMTRKMAEEVFPIPASLPNEDSWIELHRLYLEKRKAFTSDIVLLYRILESNSSGLNQSFLTKSREISERRKSLEIFMCQNKNLLDDKKIKSIEKRIALEKLRYENKTFSILFFETDSLKDKVYNIIYSNPILFYIRKRFYWLLSGYGNHYGDQ